MNLSSLLLVIISRLDGERTVNSGLHLLRGKRSGQTLQDVKYYNLKPFFALLPKLQAQIFDEAVSELTASLLISIDDEGIVHLTKVGRDTVSTLRQYHFNGWEYRGAEQKFFARLSLFVQTISQFKANEKSFMPTQKDRETQLFIKEILLRQPITNPDFSRLIKEEILLGIKKSGMSEMQKVIFTHRLSGYKQTGWTWSQLAKTVDMSPIAIHLYFIESLHLLLKAIESCREVPFLTAIAENVKIASYLTDSSRKTKKLFNNGLSMEEICTIRRLKMSTIEDHFVEMSMNDRHFPIEQFISKVQVASVMIKVETLGTKRLRILKDEFPSLSYFQLRLILGVQSKGGGEWISS